MKSSVLFVFFAVFLSVSCSNDSASLLKKAGYEADGTGLLEAVRNDDEKALDIFLTMPELLNYADKSGRNAVMLASAKKECTMLKKLVAAGANLKIMDNSEKTPLHYAAAGNSSECAEFLLENGADANLQDNFGRDAANTLISLAKEENVELFKVLIEKSSDIERRDKEKKTLFIIAAEKGYAGYAKILMSLNVSPLSKDFSGKTALDYAAESLEAGRLDSGTFDEIAVYTQKIKEKL
ncbi:ankyrin repeat domain-containing protein [bacterium]|nr:ankyrin repeat domain-containing protein [bacterium]